MILGQEDKPSLEDLIEHHGVKGMKWGHRKKRISAVEIRGARAEIATRERDVNDKAVRLNDLTRAGSGASKTQINKAAKDYEAALKGLTTTDARVNSLRYTNGEKAVLLIFAGPVGAVPIAALAGARAYESKQLAKAKQAHGVK